MALCYQRTRQAGCGGPFTKSACDACHKLEGTCLKTGKKLLPDCKGPFGDPICTYCKSLQNAGDMLDPAMSRWLSGLGLSAVVMQHVYDSTCTYSPAQIDNKYAALNDPRLPSPWVKVGNLYASVTVTGDTSWGKLVDRLYGEGKRDFMIFTGRHGQMSGTIIEDTVLKTFGAAVPEESHLTDDKSRKVRVETEYKSKSGGPINIVLCNVGTTPDTTMGKTRRLAAQCLAASDDTVVIFAWCYSLLSFYTTSAEADKATRFSDIVCYNKPVREIVAEKFGWAEVADTRSAYLSKKRKPETDSKYVTWSHSAAVTM